MKNFIVTGGLGFIGSNLIDLLISKNYYVINIDKITYSSNFYNTQEYKNSKKYKFIKCDIGEKKFTSQLMKFMVIFYLVELLKLILINLVHHMLLLKLLQII